MKKFFTIGVLAMSIMLTLTGCGKSAVTIDYTDYPENFMIKLEADQPYILKNKDSSIDFSANTHSLLKKMQVLQYGELTSDLSHAVYYRKTEPVLIHYNDRDYIWICEVENGTIASASIFYLTEYNSLGSDNGQFNLPFTDEVLNPGDFIMNKSINCFGYVSATVHYEIDEHGKPAELPTDDEFYYVDSPYSEETLCLDDDINTWVYADADAEESTVTIVPKGTTFSRLRIPKNAEYSYVEGRLEDGRVMRVIEEYWFSEPSAYQAMMDKDAQQFSYSTLP